MANLQMADKKKNNNNNNKVFNIFRFAMLTFYLAFGLQTDADEKSEYRAYPNTQTQENEKRN